MAVTQRAALSAVALLTTVLAAACGSTVPVAQQARAGAFGPDGSAPGQTAAGGAGTTGGTGSAAPGTSTGGSGAGSAVTTGGAARSGSSSSVSGPALPSGGSAGGPAAIAPTGPGWDRQYIYIGTLTVNDLHTVAGNFGINLDPGDLAADANAVADDINRHGGLLGRKIKVLTEDTKTVQVAEDPVGVGLQACTNFTQDHRVVALYNPVTTLDTENFRACFAKAHVPVFSAGSAQLDSKAIEQYAGTYYMATMVPWDKLAPVLVARLKAGGWFGGWNMRLGQPANTPPKIGIVTSSTPAGTRIAADIRNALAAAGYPGALVYQWTDASQGQSKSVQYMEGNNVDHVIVADLELTAFQNSAQSQQYKPRYGVSTYNDPYTNLETLSPKGANNGAMGIGWAPAYDVSDANDPGGTGTGQARCLKANAAAGQNFSGKRTARLFALAACDSIYLAAAGAARAGALDAASIYRGALAVAPSFSSAVSFGNAALSPQHLFLSSSARDLAYFTDCSCFKYTSRTPTGHF